MVPGRWPTFAKAESARQGQKGEICGVNWIADQGGDWGGVMKRRSLLRHLGNHNCVIVREGKAHTCVQNLKTNSKSFVPRHREIKPSLVLEICRQLGIAPPSEK